MEETEKPIKEEREFEVMPMKKLEDGLHKGTILNVNYREKPYEYTDFTIEEDESKLKLVVGYPSFVTTESKLGNLLARFGTEMAVGNFVNPNDLINKKCQFLIQNDAGKNGKVYSNILPKSLKPLLEQKTPDVNKTQI